MEEIDATEQMLQSIAIQRDLIEELSQDFMSTEGLEHPIAAPHLLEMSLCLRRLEDFVLTRQRKEESKQAKARLKEEG